MKTRFAAARAGFSLVLSLIILTLLAILVVGFLSSTAMDRATAHAFSDKARAEAAAGTAANQAMSMLREYLGQYPDSVTAWEKLTPSAGGPDVEGTMLYYYDVPPPNGFDATSGATAPKRYVLPLLSRSVDSNGAPLGPVEVANKTRALGTETWHEAAWQEGKVLREPDCIDLNRPRFNDDKSGWIGASASGRKPYYAKWIEQKENGNLNGRTISRYAFWVEDESFKVNLNMWGASPRGAEKTQLDAATLANRISELPIQGLLRSTRPGAGANRDTIATDVKNLRDSFVGKRLMDLASFNQIPTTFPAADGQPSRLGTETKFLATAFSGALNLSRQGSQRLNLNALGFGIAPEKNAPADVEAQLYQLVETIRYHAPDFGQRFYRAEDELQGKPVEEAARRNAKLVSAAHQNIYLHKVSANIRDYLDLDFKPTIVEAPNPPSSDPKFHGKLWTRAAPVTAMSADEGDNAAWAQGKESAPYLQEAIVRFRGGPTSAERTRYILKTDYYIEFWNMTGEDISATDVARFGNQPFLRIANRPAWREQLSPGSGIGPPLTADNSPAGHPSEAAEFLMYLTSTDPNKPILHRGTVVPGVVFKAGNCTVVTSDPDAASDPTKPGYQGLLGINWANTYVSRQLSPNTKREFEGPLKNPKVIGILPIYRDSGSSDYQTEVVLGNDEGYLDSHGCAVSLPSVTGLKSPTDEGVYGGNLFGNSSTPSQLVDPRTNNEQLSIKRFKSQADGPEPDQTRYFNATAATSRSLGLPNYQFVNPQQAPAWKDYYKGWENPIKATERTFDPTFIANSRLVSVGQLGDIFDPARVNGNIGTLRDAPTQYLYSRGGGRTLKIGQPDDLVDATSANAPSRAWASWRLCDFFSDSSEVQLPGAININGLARDNGAALRAAFYEITMSGAARSSAKNSVLKSGSDWKLNSDENAAMGLQPLITAALERMTQNDPALGGYDASKPYFGPFAERGEFSELANFNTGSSLLSDKFDASVEMNFAFDRTREAVFRRMVDFITTRGNIFSVYAVGQSITEGPPPLRQKRVTGSHQVKVTFEVVPKKQNGDDFGAPIQSFNPGTEAAIRERFAAPHHYDIRILQVSS